MPNRNQVEAPQEQEVIVREVVADERLNINPDPFFDDLGMDEDMRGEVELEQAFQEAQAAARIAAAQANPNIQVDANQFIWDIPGGMNPGFIAGDPGPNLGNPVNYIVGGIDPMFMPPPQPRAEPARPQLRGFDRLIQDEMNRQLNRRRRGAALVHEDGVAIPRDLANEPNPPVRREQAPAKKAPVKIKVDNKKAAFPEDGVMHPSGHRFARKLTLHEDVFLRNYGYMELIMKYKDLKWNEKDKPVDPDEEVILTISELADHYATEDCKNAITDFDVKEHNKEYQIAYKKHVKTIAGFKRNKNG